MLIYFTYHTLFRVSTLQIWQRITNRDKDSWSCHSCWCLKCASQTLQITSRHLSPAAFLGQWCLITGLTQRYHQISRTNTEKLRLAVPVQSQTCAALNLYRCDIHLQTLVWKVIEASQANAIILEVQRTQRYCRFLGHEVNRIFDVKVKINSKMTKFSWVSRKPSFELKASDRFEPMSCLQSSCNHELLSKLREVSSQCTLRNF